MPQVPIKKVLLGLLFLSGCGPLLADEVDALREEARAIQAAATMLAKQGNQKQAERLEMEAVQILNMAERQENKSKGTSAKEAGPDLERETRSSKVPKKDWMNKDEGEHRPEIRAQMEKLEIATRRIKHFRVAAENLKMAEEHDLAMKLMERAEDMERDVQNAKLRLVTEMDKGRSEKKAIGSEAIGQLKNEIERLRAEVKELKLRLEKR